MTVGNRTPYRGWALPAVTMTVGTGRLVSHG